MSIILFVIYEIYYKFIIINIYDNTNMEFKNLIIYEYVMEARIGFEPMYAVLQTAA